MSYYRIQAWEFLTDAELYCDTLTSQVHLFYFLYNDDLSIGITASNGKIIDK
jgi:hypothetical protein